MAIRARKLKPKEQMSDATWDYLRDKHDANDKTDMFRWFEIFALDSDNNKNIDQLWATHRDVVLNEHIKERPGTRPALWWKFDAPRLPMGISLGVWCKGGKLPEWCDGKLPEPRNRLGGAGRPAYEVKCYKPSFQYGLPDIWEGIDENDLPTFESHAAFLKRNGSLFPGEEKRSDFSPETIPADCDWELVTGAILKTAREFSHLQAVGRIGWHHARRGLREFACGLGRPPWL